MCPPKRCDHLVWDVRATPHVGVRFGKAGVGRTLSLFEAFQVYVGLWSRLPVRSSFRCICFTPVVGRVSLAWVGGRGQPRKTVLCVLRYHASGCAGVVSHVSLLLLDGVRQRYVYGGSSCQRIRRLRFLSLLAASERCWWHLPLGARSIIPASVDALPSGCIQGCAPRVGCVAVCVGVSSFGLA